MKIPGISIDDKIIVTANPPCLLLRVLLERNIKFQLEVGENKDVLSSHWIYRYPFLMSIVNDYMTKKNKKEKRFINYLSKNNFPCLLS